jgi:hypothetical protein
MRDARRAGQGLGPSFDFARDLGPPMGAVRCYIKNDLCTLNTSDLPAFGKQRADKSRKSPDMATEDAG